MDVNWSPDGNSLIFATDGIPNAPISILDLNKFSRELVPQEF
jgi:hypothetical protein